MLRLAHSDSGQGIAQIIAKTATNATVGQRHGLAVLRRDQRGVDIDGAEIIHQNPPALMRTGKQVVDQGGFARAKEAANDGQRDHEAVKTCPPITVATTGISLMVTGSTVSGSSSSTAKSANFPTSMLPSRWSSLSV